MRGNVPRYITTLLCELAAVWGRPRIFMSLPRLTG